MTGAPLEGYRVRWGGAADAEVIAEQRAGMFQDMGVGDEAARSRMVREFTAWVRPRLARGDYRAWLVEHERAGVVAGAGLVVVERPPSPLREDDRRAYVLNVFTEPAHRRKGIARWLMDAVLDWCRRERFGIVELHATPEGRPLYERLGFEPTNEMRLVLRGGEPS